MTVDLRAIVATDLGICVSGDVGANHISDRSGLVMVQGRLQFDGIVTPARGTLASFLVACPQTGIVSRFPKPLRVIRAVAYPQERRSEVEVGCRLTLMKERKDAKTRYLATSELPTWYSSIPNGYAQFFAPPIQAQSLLEFCLDKIGISLAAGSHQLQFTFLQSSIDLSGGYVQLIGDLCRSEGCFGRLRPDETFEVVPIDLQKGQKGPVLRAQDLVSIEPITGGAEPPDSYKVSYQAAERLSSLTGGDKAAPLDWTKDITVSPPQKIVLQWTKTNGASEIVTLTHQSISVSKTLYKTVFYSSVTDIEEQSEVAFKKTDSKYTSIASINPTYATERLKFNYGLPQGTVKTVDITTTEYTGSSSGPTVSKEITEHYESLVQFAASLPIKNYVTKSTLSSSRTSYVGLEIYEPSTALFLTQRTIRQHEQFRRQDGRDVTKTRTSRWMALGSTQEGQQQAAKRLALPSVSRSANAVSDVVNSLLELRFEGTEVATDISKAPTSAKPPDQDVLRFEVLNGRAPFDESDYSALGFDNEKPPSGLFNSPDSRYQAAVQRSDFANTFTSAVRFDGQPYDDGNVTTSTTYDMPYAPDDYFAYLSNVRVLVRGGARAAAERFGRTEVGLDMGHAFGFNIVTSFARMPTLELSPLYIQSGGLEVAFLVDSVSYAWSADGMVVSSDLMLLGVTGYYGATRPTSSWVRLPVAISALPLVAAASSDGDPMKANTITLPSGFDVRNPSPTLALLPSDGVDTWAEWKQDGQLIGPVLEQELLGVEAGPFLSLLEFEYALTLETEVAVMASGPVIVESTIVVSPAVAVAAISAVPAVASGASVAVPVVAVAVAPQQPVVASGASAAVPAAGIAVAAVAPLQVGRPRTEVSIPAAAVAVAAVAPSVASGGSVAVPAANVTVAGVAPTVQTGLLDPNFSSVSLLLHMNGSNNSTTFTDSSSNRLTLTVNGDAKISTDQSKYGGAAALFDGSGDYINTASSALFDFGGGTAFTVECWLYRTDITVSAPFVGQRIAGVYAPFELQVIGTGGLRLLAANASITSWSAVSDTSSNVLSANTWQHIALVGDGTNIKLYVGGSSVLTVTQSSWTSANRTMYIGKGGDGSFSGRIDDLRITKGVARYTASFTPPTAQFPDG